MMQSWILADKHILLLRPNSTRHSGTQWLHQTVNNKNNRNSNAHTGTENGLAGVSAHISDEIITPNKPS